MQTPDDMSSRQAPHARAATPGEPNVGEVLRRLRRQRGLSMREAAEGSGLSASFLGAVERGESDISVGRLAQVARFYGHDVASLLGYTSRPVEPRLIRAAESVHLSRGEGVQFTALRVPGTTLEFMIASFEPGARFDDTVTHAGIDVMYIATGSLVLEFDGREYPLATAECAVWPSSHGHSVRNDGDTAALAIGFTTETVYS
jgi:transcriptional regulator with XRE-family HTH domain